FRHVERNMMLDSLSRSEVKNDLAIINVLYEAIRLDAASTPLAAPCPQKGRGCTIGGQGMQYPCVDPCRAPSSLLGGLDAITDGEVFQPPVEKPLPGSKGGRPAGLTEDYVVTIDFAKERDFTLLKIEYAQNQTVGDRANYTIEHHVSLDMAQELSYGGAHCQRQGSPPVLSGMRAPGAEPPRRARPCRDGTRGHHGRDCPSPRPTLSSMIMPKARWCASPLWSRGTVLCPCRSAMVAAHRKSGACGWKTAWTARPA